MPSTSVADQHKNLSSGINKTHWKNDMQQMVIHFKVSSA